MGVFKSQFSAEKIEALLRSIPNLFAKSNIITDWQSGSGTNEQVIGAAALTSILSTLDKRTKGEGLKSQISDATDCNVLTDDLKQKIDDLSLNYVGVVSDVIQRNEINTTDFTGGETIILLSNLYGNVSIQHWAVTNNTWVDLYPEQANERRISIPTATSALIREFPLASYQMVTLDIHARTDSYIHSAIVKVGYIQGSSTVYTFTGSELLSDGGTPLFNINAVIVDPNLQIRVQTLLNNVDVKVSLLSSF